MNKPLHIPIPLFDTLQFVAELYKRCQLDNPQLIINQWLQQCISMSKNNKQNENNQPVTLPDYAHQDYHCVLSFLYSYRGSADTFNAYRRELERLLQWCWFVRNQSICRLKRLDIEDFLEFCRAPQKAWIATETVARFIDQEGLRVPNPSWRPFNVKVSKKAFQDGKRAAKGDYQLSQQGIKVIFAVLGSFYNYLIQEEQADINPVQQIRQKSKFIRKTQQAPMIRRLSDLQWETVISTAEILAKADPEQHMRTFFIMNAMYAMYLRISELAATSRWMPRMCDFFRDSNGDWWFKTVGKGNKERQIAVSDAMLNALRAWRQHLNLTPLPTPDDTSPLIPKLKGKGPIESTRMIRHIVQHCFDTAITELRAQNLPDEAEMLRSATVHWLRHTGISDDVKRRPREHVRDDAGHSSSAITDRYIDIQLQERAKSAKKKPLHAE